MTDAADSTNLEDELRAGRLADRMDAEALAATGGPTSTSGSGMDEPADPSDDEHDDEHPADEPSQH